MHLRFQIPRDDQAAFQRMAASHAFAQFDGYIGNENRVRVEHKGLRIDYWPNSGQGRVRGSLHTFALGNNRGVFNAETVKAACLELAQELGIPADWLHVCRMEIGVNIRTPASPESFLNTLRQHKRKLFYPLDPPRNATRPLQFVATYRDYRIKFYDKSEYDRSKGKPVNASEHLMRYEVAFSRSRPLLKLVEQKQLTLVDLANTRLMALFGNHLIKHWNLIKHRTIKRYEGRTIQQALLLHAYEEEELWQCAKLHTPPSTFNDYRHKADRLMQEVRQNDGPSLYDILFREHLNMLLPDQ